MFFVNWYSVNTVLKYWQYPESIRQHPETPQTLSRLYPITSVFSRSVKPYSITLFATQ